jgi:hypothetical protein
MEPRCSFAIYAYAAYDTVEIGRGSYAWNKGFGEFDGVQLRGVAEGGSPSELVV